MTTKMMMVVVGLVCATLVGCNKDDGATSPSTQAAASAKTDDLAGGTKHDPPIKPDGVAAGHWYCDMGTVHYSRAEEGDGKCALCGMKLKHKE